jgi:tetratricopeptide (TPR) repeat protein
MRLPLKRTVQGVFVWSALVAASFAQTQPPARSPQLIESLQLNARVVKLYGEQKYDEALPLAKRALDLRTAELGANHRDLIPLLLNLAELYRAKQQPNDARSYYQKALQISESSFGVEDLRTVQVVDKLAYLAGEQREIDRAEKLLLRSLAIKEKALGADHSEVAETCLRLGDIYRFQHEYSKAESYYRQVIRIREQPASKNDQQLMKALEGDQVVLIAQNKKDEAAQVQKQLAQLSEDSGVVEGGVLNGRAVKLVQPSYPAGAARIPILIVRVRVLIDETGKVISAQALEISGFDPRFKIAAEEAARHSIFTPTLVAGVPVKVPGIIIYQFRQR